jgi:hypothetical protein
VHINAPTGAYQQQYESPLSFPVRLKKGSLVTRATYRTAFAAEQPFPPCLGTVREPVAETGNLCVYRGQSLGSIEGMDKNAAFFGFTDLAGELFTTSKKVGNLGELVLFRSVNNSPFFKEEFGEAEPGVITEAAYMEGGGSWAVTER